MGSVFRAPVVAQASKSLPPQPAAPAPPLFKDSSGKAHKTTKERDAAQAQIERKAKFAKSPANIGNLQQVRKTQSTGKPTVTNPVVATASSGSGISIAGV